MEGNRNAGSWQISKDRNTADLRGFSPQGHESPTSTAIAAHKRFSTATA
jgi:hypothetical protein